MVADFVLWTGQMRGPGSLRSRLAGAIVALCVIVYGPPPATAQTPDGQPVPPTDGSAAGGVNPDRLPVDIGKIQRALSRPPAITLETKRSVFRIEIFGRKPTIEDILGPDYQRGPAPAGAMTHQEFLNMVTPTDVRGYAAFDNRQGITVATTAFALQWALQKAVQKFNDAKEQRAREAARKEVEEALAELRRARRAAGLPDK
jgi:hypothetical protein